MKMGTVGLLVGVALSTGVPMQAQESGSNSTAAAMVMLSLRAHGTAGDAVGILRQVDSTWSRQYLDALADSLAAFALTEENSDERRAAVTYAVLALAQSGAAEGRGTPYAGAGDRLLRIAEESKALAGGALMSVAQLANRSEAMLKLRRLAVEDDRLAASAVDKLERYGGPEGIRVLAELYRDRSVNPGARTLLDRIADKRNWRRQAPLSRP